MKQGPEATPAVVVVVVVVVVGADDADNAGVLLGRTCDAARDLSCAFPDMSPWDIVTLTCIEPSVCCMSERCWTAARHACTSHRTRRRSSGAEEDRQSRFCPEKSVSRKLDLRHAVSRGCLGYSRP